MLINTIEALLILIVTNITNMLKIKEPHSTYKHSKFRDKLNDSLNRIKDNPLNPDLHYQLANIYALNKNWQLAIAEYRTSMALGNNTVRLFISLALSYLEIKQKELAESIFNKIPKPVTLEINKQYENYVNKYKITNNRPLSDFKHNRYYRMKTLSDKLNSLFVQPDFSILDVGGGDGAFSLFVPDAKYVLAEPGINGISGIDLPFEENYFDVVIACHVLEHIPQEKRMQFLQELCSVARKYVLLLNPFYIPNTFVTERLKLNIKITNSEYAKEHLKFELPKLIEIKNFAEKYNYKYRIHPNGSLATSFAFVFLDHFAPLAGKRDSLLKINNFYNTCLFDKLTNPELPTAYLVEIII